MSTGTETNNASDIGQGLDEQNKPVQEAVEAEVSRPMRVLNVKEMTTIPNSCAKHSIYTYSTKVDEVGDLKRKGFFNPAYSFLSDGDTVRVFEYQMGKLYKYYEFIVMAVDKINKTVTVAIVNERVLEKVVI